MVKKCCKCRQKKKLKFFHKHKKLKYKRQNYCIQCRIKSRWKDKLARIKNIFGLTEKQVIEILKIQKNKCSLCLKGFNKYRDMNVDHDHKTGKVRGILHWKCNLDLGLYESKVSFYNRIPKYLKGYEELKG